MKYQSIPSRRNEPFFESRYNVIPTVFWWIVTPDAPVVWRSPPIHDEFAIGLKGNNIGGALRSEAGLMALNDKQRRFVEQYLLDLNATQAAIRAGYAVNGAEVQGHRLLSNANVAATIATAQKERAQRTSVDAAWLLTRLAQEAVADVGDLYDESGHLKPVHQWPLIWRQGLVAGLEVEELRGDDKAPAVIRKIKLSDRTRRLELIGKHIGVQAFRDQVGLGSPTGGPVQTELTIRFVGAGGQLLALPGVLHGDPVSGEDDGDGGGDEA